MNVYTCRKLFGYTSKLKCLEVVKGCFAFFGGRKLFDGQGTTTVSEAT